MKRIVSLNIIFSLLLQLVAIANSFVTTKVTIYYFGTEIEKKKAGNVLTNITCLCFHYTIDEQVS